MSGPLLDRIDLRIEVPIVTSEELWAKEDGESCTVVRERITAARGRQRSRGALNAQLWIPAMQKYCALDTAGRRLLVDAVDRYGISARAVQRAIRVALTIADLAGEDRIAATKVAEALQYRNS